MSTPTTIEGALGDVAGDIAEQVPVLVVAAVPVLAALAAVSIGLGIFRKFGLKR